MSEILQKIILKLKKLKLEEKKYILCSFIGLIDRELLCSLQFLLEPINFRKSVTKESLTKKPEIMKNIEIIDEDEIYDLQEVSEKLVDEILTKSIQMINNEYISSHSFDKFLINDNNIHKVKENFKLPPIEHEHTLKLENSKHFNRATIKNKKQFNNFPNAIDLLIKTITTEFSSNKKKSTFLSEVLCSEDWEIQFHVYQCVKRRLLDKWSMDSIPSKILENIFAYVSPDDLLRTSLVNKLWFSVSRSNTLWRNHCISFGKSIGFLKLTDIIEENIAEESKINWFEIYKTIKGLFKKNPGTDLKVDLPKRKLQFYNVIKSVRIITKLTRKSPKRSISDNTSRRLSRTTSKSSTLLYPDPENDTRQLMKPIIGKMKQFQKSEEIAIDLKTSNLVSVFDKTNQSESKLNLKWIDPNSENVKSTSSTDQRQIKKILNIESCYKLTGHLDGVTMVKFDKSRMFSSSCDGSLRIWDSVSGRSLRKLYGHKGAVYCLDFFHQILVSGGWDTSIFVWSLEPNFNVVKILYGHMGSITSLKFVKNKEKLISASLDGTVRMYNTNGFKLENVVTIKSTRTHQPVGIIDMKIEENRNLIATCHCDKSIKIIDMDKTECVYNIGYQKDVLKCLYFQSCLLISGGHSGYLQFWDMNLASCSNSCKAEIQIVTDKQLPLSVESIFYHLKSLWTGHNDGSIKEWHLSSMTCIRTIYGHKAAINSLYCFDDMMGSASLDGSIRMWRLSTSHCHKLHEEKYQNFKEQIPISRIFK